MDRNGINNRKFVNVKNAGLETLVFNIDIAELTSQGFNLIDN